MDERLSLPEFLSPPGPGVQVQLSVLFPSTCIKTLHSVKGNSTTVRFILKISAESGGLDMLSVIKVGRTARS